MDQQGCHHVACMESDIYIQQWWIDPGVFSLRYLACTASSWQRHPEAEGEMGKGVVGGLWGGLERSMGAHSSGLLNWHWSSWEQRCNRSQLLLWEWELFPSPVGWSRVLWERLWTASVERGSAPLRTAELDSNIRNRRQWKGGESPRSVLFWGVVIYVHRWRLIDLPEPDTVCVIT